MQNCWANSLGNCAGKISGEHIVSNSILDKTVKVKGFSWCKDNAIEIGSSSFTNKILCEKHNSELSTFDSEAKNFVSVIDNFCKKNEDFEKFGFRKKNIPIIHQVSGINLEHWCTKTLINVGLSQKEDFIIHFDKILPALFEGKNLEKPYGLNFAVRSGQSINTKDFFEISPLLNENSDKKKELAGGLFVFRGFRLILLLPCSKHDVVINNELGLNLSEEIKKDWIGLQLNWHNKNINYTNRQGKKIHLMQIINFKW